MGWRRPSGIEATTRGVANRPTASRSVTQMIESPAQAAELVPGPTVTDSSVVFNVADPAHEFDGVRLELDWNPGDAVLDFDEVPGGWTLNLPRPAVNRIEYQFTFRRLQDYRWTTDPANPALVPNPFGEKSELLFPDYRPPEWLRYRDTGSAVTVVTDAGGLEQPVPITLWSPIGLAARTRAPLLLVHDGSDMADRGSMLRWASWAQHAQLDDHGYQAAPFRVALLDPPSGLRDTWYAANAAYSEHLTKVVIPAIADRVSVGAVIGLGASLGALAIAALQDRQPKLLHAMALQSGSFFTAELDGQEDSYSQFEHICSAVRHLTDRAPNEIRPVPGFITCGAVEENLGNNEAIGAVLSEQGYELRFDVVGDAHTMIGWRDAWSPDLEDLIRVAGERFVPASRKYKAREKR